MRQPFGSVNGNLVRPCPSSSTAAAPLPQRRPAGRPPWRLLAAALSRLLARPTARETITSHVHRGSLLPQIAAASSSAGPLIAASVPHRCCSSDIGATPMLFPGGRRAWSRRSRARSGWTPGSPRAAAVGDGVAAAVVAAGGADRILPYPKREQPPVRMIIFPNGPGWLPRDYREAVIAARGRGGGAPPVACPAAAGPSRPAFPASPAPDGRPGGRVVTRYAAFARI